MADVTDHLSHIPLDLDSAFADPRDDCGATVAFVGTVRNNHAGRRVDGLDYSAHEPSAAAELEKLCAEAREKFDIEELRIIHRLGALKLGDSAVLLVCRSGHRDAAFEAARWALETLKQRVPIFKKEHYCEGDSEWLDGHSLVADADVPDPKSA